jgi:hypothetical protein
VPASGTITISVMIAFFGLRGSLAGPMPMAAGHTPGSSDAHLSLTTWRTDRQGNRDEPLGWRATLGSSGNSATTLPASSSAGLSTRAEIGARLAYARPETGDAPTAIATGRSVPRR